MVPSRWQFLVLPFASSLIRAAEAYTLFVTNCSVPATLANFVTSPNTRGTIDLLWSSLLTLVACTWTIQHPNVPEQHEGLVERRANFLKAVKDCLNDAKWMICTILAPEVIITAATHDFVSARNTHKRLLSIANSKDKVNWTITHTYFANMGGFVLRGITQRGEDESNPPNKPYHLTAYSMIILRDGGFIPRLPDIRTEDIKDRCKDDMFVKAIALAQILWASSQAVVRAIRGLTTSPLEVAVLGFAACAVAIYILYWEKPKGPRSVITIEHWPDRRDIFDVLSAQIEEEEEGMSIVNQLLLVAEFFPMRKPGSPFSLDHVRLEEDTRLPAFFAVMLGAVLFGAVHLGARNRPFPTTAELILWRCASLCTTAYGLLLAGIRSYSVHRWMRGDAPEWSMITIGLITITATYIYLLFRLVILVEIFRSLFFMPPDAFVATWTSNLPHLG